MASVASCNLCATHDEYRVELRDGTIKLVAKADLLLMLLNTFDSKKDFDDFPVEVLELIFAFLGSCFGGYVERRRLRTVCKKWASICAKLPAATQACSIVLAEMLPCLTLQRLESMRVFDVRRRRVATIGSHAMQLWFSFPAKQSLACKSVRLYRPDNRLVWWSKRDKVWLSVEMGACDNDSIDGPDAIHPSFAQLLHRNVKIDPHVVRDLTSQMTCGPACRRVKMHEIHAAEQFQQAFDSIIADLYSPINASLSSFELIGHSSKASLPTNPMISIQSVLGGPRLQRLTLTHIAMTFEDVHALAKWSQRLMVLELTGCIDLGSDNVKNPSFLSDVTSVVRAFGRLLRAWSAESEGRRSLILDDTPIMDLSPLIFGLLASEDEIEYISHSVLTERVFLSASSCSCSHFVKAVAEAKLLPISCLDEQVPAPAPASNPQKKKKKEVQAPNNEPTHTEPLPGSYINANRERDRYMWQWWTYECQSCGVKWPKNTVTISWRQTCVSECLKGKRSCKQRPEYQDMINGQLWITNKHVVGTPGGLNLTPPPEMVQDMETRFGCLVAVHPSSGQYEYFTMHETRIGQKIRRTPP